MTVFVSETDHYNELLYNSEFQLRVRDPIRMGQLRVNDHPHHAPQFTRSRSLVVSIFLFKDVLQFNDDMEHVNEIIKCQNPLKPRQNMSLFSLESKVWKGIRILKYRS